jgi:hypothetical protein
MLLQIAPYDQLEMLERLVDVPSPTASAVASSWYIWENIQLARGQEDRLLAPRKFIGLQRILKKCYSVGPSSVDCLLNKKKHQPSDSSDPEMMMI